MKAATWMTISCYGKDQSASPRIMPTRSTTYCGTGRSSVIQSHLDVTRDRSSLDSRSTSIVSSRYRRRPTMLDLLPYGHLRHPPLTHLSSFVPMSIKRVGFVGFIYRIDTYTHPYERKAAVLLEAIRIFSEWHRFPCVASETMGGKALAHTCAILDHSFDLTLFFAPVLWTVSVYNRSHWRLA